MTFRELAIGDRFQFVGEYAEGYDWWWIEKTGPRTYRTRPWFDGSGGTEGRVGVGDNAVRRVGSEAH